jgi:hypothetical protein
MNDGDRDVTPEQAIRWLQADLRDLDNENERLHDEMTRLSSMLHPHVCGHAGCAYDVKLSAITPHPYN